MTPPAQTDFAATAVSTPALQLTALLKATGISALNQTGWLRVTGEDRVRWLNGMVTNSIQHSASPTKATTTSSSTRRAASRATPPSSLSPTPSSSRPPPPNSPTSSPTSITSSSWTTSNSPTSQPPQSGILVAGPQAPSLLAQIGINVDSLEPLTTSTLHVERPPTVTVIHAHSPLVPRFELWTTPEAAPELQNCPRPRLARSTSTPEALESLRILEGTPLYGTDIRNSEKARELPQETAQTRALHFNKGCYLGQEIVERIRSRGNVHRTFAAFRLDGQLPAAGHPSKPKTKP